MPDDIDFARAGEIRDEILDDAPDIDGLRIELGGFIFAEFEEPSSEVLGLAFAIVILILAFGSVLAMGLPVGVALFGIGIGTAIITLLSNVLTVPDFATFLGIMIGLGVGIDYALLIVTRYREQLHAGHTVRESVTIAIDTAGRSVLFAGTTVVISLLGMLLMGVSFVQGLAVGAASVVAVTVVASLTLLPALLGFAGERIELHPLAGPHRRRPRRRRPRRRRPRRSPRSLIGLPAGRHRAHRRLLRRPAQAGGAPPAAQAAAGDDRLPLEPGHPAPAVARGHRRRGRAARAGRARARRCGSGSPTRATSPRTPPPSRPTTCWSTASAPASTARSSSSPSCPRAPTLADARRRSPRRPPPTPASPSSRRPARTTPTNPTAVVWNLVPTTGPQDEATTDLVNRLRDDVLPPAEAGRRRRGRRHRHRRRERRLLRLPRRPGCRTSSPPCWRCRSCC